MRQDYWREFPPTHVLVRSIAVGLGVFKPAPEPQRPRDADALETLRAMFPQGRL